MYYLHHIIDNMFIYCISSLPSLLSLMTSLQITCLSLMRHEAGLASEKSVILGEAFSEKYDRTVINRCVYSAVVGEVRLCGYLYMALRSIWS